MILSDATMISLFKEATPVSTPLSIANVYCCDLLSNAMIKAPKESAWVTVIANTNTLAVAEYAEVSCIVLAEGVTFNEDDLFIAKKRNIRVFYSDLPVFETALLIHEKLES